MVKLTKIKKTDGRITCVAFVEDCKEPVEIVFYTADGSIQNSSLPEGYKWCKSHIHHVQNALREMACEENPPEKWTIMWY